MTISPFIDGMPVSGVGNVPQMSQNKNDKGDASFKDLMDTVTQTGNAPDVSKTETFKQVQDATEPAKTSDDKTADTSDNVKNEVKSETSGNDTDSKLNTDKNDSLSNHKDVNDTGNENVVSELKDKILNEAAKKLGINVEELTEILANLGITAADLLNTDNISLLVSEVVGEGDMVSLITDENALSLVNELNTLIADIVTEVSDESGIPVPELTEMAEVPEITEEIPVITDTDDEPVVQISEEPVKAETVKTTDAKDRPVSEQTRTTQGVADTRVNDNTQVSANNNNDTNNGQFTDRKSETGRDNTENGQSLFSQVADTNEFSVNDIQKPEDIFPQSMVDTEEIINQVKDQIKANVTGEMTSLEMQLNPENLGTVNLSVASRGGNVTAQLHVQNDTVLQALEAQIAQIRESLEAQGVKINAIEVAVSSHGFEQNLEQGNDSNEQQEDAAEALRKATRKLNLNGGLTDEIIEELDEAEMISAEMMAADGNSMDYKV